MPIRQVNVCTGSTTLAPGEHFEFISFQSVECDITNCSPPLVNSSYTVPAANGPNGSTCPAQVQSPVQDGTYNLSINCCSQNGHPIVIIQG